MINSKIIFGILGLLFVGIVWLRMYWGRQRNKNQSKKIIEDLKSGLYNIESYAEALNIMILSKPGIHEPDFQKIKQSLHDLSKAKILGKVKIEYCDVNKKGKAIVVGEGFIKDFVNDREIDIFYPCWLFVDINAENVSFKSTFPENKEHHYLLEDLSEEMYNQCFKN